MGVAFFLMVQYWLKSGFNTYGNLIYAAIGCVFCGAVTHFTDYSRYQRYLRKKNPSSK
jgi:hypothetical protein